MFRMKKDIFVLISVLLFTFGCLIGSVLIAGILTNENLEKIGIRNNPEFDDGELIVCFDDQDETFPSLVSNGTALFKAPDLVSCSVKRVHIPAIAGVSIEPRLNLSFIFDGDLLDESKTETASPIINVFIDSPVKGSSVNYTEDESGFLVGSKDWDFHVLVDCLNDFIRIEDNAGNFLADGIAIYSSSYEDDQHLVTRFTAALPLKLIGDPNKGKWNLYVATSFFPQGGVDLLDGNSVPVFCDAIRSIVETSSGSASHIRLLPLTFGD